MKRAKECADGCEYARDVGMPEYSCEKICQRKELEPCSWVSLFFTALLVWCFLGLSMAILKACGVY